MTPKYHGGPYGPPTGCPMGQSLWPHILAIGLGLLGLVSCSGPQAHTVQPIPYVTHTAEQDNAVTAPTRTREATSTTSPASSPTPTPPPLLPSLPPGLYLVYSAPSSRLDQYGYPMTSLRIVGMEGRAVNGLTIPGGDDWAISPDSRWLSFGAWKDPGQSTEDRWIELLGLETAASFRVPGRHFGIGSWSPDGIYLAIDDGWEVSLLAVETGEETQLTQCAQWDPLGEAQCGFASWSPDGRWIAFWAAFPHSGEVDPRNGVYFLDTQCAPRVP